MASTVTCKCGSQLKVTAEVIGKRVSCPTCGRVSLLHRKERAQIPRTSLATIPQRNAPAVPTKYQHSNESIYSPSEYAAAAPQPPLMNSPTVESPVQSSYSLTSFPVIVTVLMHFLTLGIFTQFWLVSLHGKLPKVREDGPSGGKAIGYMFIPLFNLYWMSFCCHRLCVRLNEQLTATGRREPLPTALGVMAQVLLFIPILNWVSVLVLLPLFLGIVQSKVNELAEGGSLDTRRVNGYQGSDVGFLNSNSENQAMHNMYAQRSTTYPSNAPNRMPEFEFAQATGHRML